MTLVKVLLNCLPPFNFFSMSSLSENKTQEVPSSFLSLMAALGKYTLTYEANKIVRECEDEEEDEETRIAKLQALLKVAPDKLDAKISRAAVSDIVIAQVSFQRLRIALQICDVLKRCKIFSALLEDHGLNPNDILQSTSSRPRSD